MVWKSNGYQDKTELAKVSLALAVESTEPEEIMDIFSQIEGIALNQKNCSKYSNRNIKSCGRCYE